MLASDLRRRYIEFFKERGHQEVPSSSLVPEGDATLLFTNAGMVQFKKVFLGQDTRPYKRAVTSQKCVRAGGKHNDLEQVGLTDRHHTFFEMLGNFSFGDYFKRDAITFAWDWVTSSKYLGIAPERIRVSVHHTDDDARKLWREIAGLPDDRIYSLGDKDNFWQMADTGPCGPCSEIHVDLRDGGSGVGADLVSVEDFVEQTEAGLFLEIWNLVFMQYDKQPDGTLKPLPAPSVDTGEGLERTTSVLQGVRSNYHTDLFLPLIKRAEQVLGRTYEGAKVEGGRVIESPTLTPVDISFRVLADHARAVAFLLADGVYPSNEGRGYVLRRILRRAVRHAYLLGRRSPTLVELVDEVGTVMGAIYPQLVQRRDHLLDVTRAEEERFLETIEGGLVRMSELTNVGAEEAFRLYDTFGFPIDLTQIIAAEKNIPVDVAGFEKLLDQQRARSRAARKAGAGATGFGAPAVRKKRGEGWQKNKLRLRQRWVGYETTAIDTDILAFRTAEHRVGLLLRDNPFYAESGGQVSDHGLVRGEGWTTQVDEVRKEDGKTAVFGELVEGTFEPTRVHAAVDEPRRRDIERNHTVTHLVHAALRKTLGSHVHQAGSVVSPEHMRFDFSHHQPVGAELLARVEREVNQHIWENLEVITVEMKYDDARALGAMALFGEKYGDVVRVVTVPDVSIELCGGTHVRTTGQIGLVKLVGESGVGAGVRRLEALTGPGAFAWFTRQQQLLLDAAAKLGSTPEHLAKRVEALSDEQRKLHKRVEELIKGGGGAAAQVAVENGTSIAVSSTASGDRNEIGAMVDAFRSKTPSGVTVIFATGEKPGIHVGVTDDLVKRGVTAGEVVNRIAALTGGKGGGRPHFASAGAGDAGRLPEAEQQAPGIIRELLAAHA